MEFDWDDGNRDKCRKHGLTVETIEAILRANPIVGPDPYAGDETRFRAIGRSIDGRAVIVIFTFREKDEALAIRPISARYMHAKEVRKYEQDQQG